MNCIKHWKNQGKVGALTGPDGGAVLCGLREVRREEEPTHPDTGPGSGCGGYSNCSCNWYAPLSESDDDNPPGLTESESETDKDLREILKEVIQRRRRRRTQPPIKNSQAEKNALAFHG